MSKHDDIMNGLGLHGRAVVATLELIADRDRTAPCLDDVSNRIGVDETALRKIFPDDESLLFAVAEQALMRLMDVSTRAVVKIDPDDAVGQFVALGRAYVHWAADHRMQFRLIFGDPKLNAGNVPGLRRYLDSMIDLMTRMLERARDSGSLREGEDIPMLVLSSRIFAQGLAQMVVDGRTDTWFPGLTPQESAEQVVEDFVRRIARGSTRRPRSRH
ncbi:TetR-like C-terminal domain-containing protein [uncultured Paracoccus sp.]|uniref:TetR-like C-terminal domain-containing protein n=1 Tax=uncultured Paracoccus sp. TaxID=189685 RepID=UPI0025F7169B|nr:TetR-like C-terminal domain-containing protein [uncultured Paracoccus sp.]